MASKNPVVAENLATMKKYHDMKKNAAKLYLYSRTIDDINEAAGDFIALCMARGEQADYYDSPHFQAFLTYATHEFTRRAAESIVNPRNYGDADAWHAHVKRWPNFAGAVAERLDVKICEHQQIMKRYAFDRKAEDRIRHAEEIRDELKRSIG